MFDGVFRDWIVFLMWKVSVMAKVADVRLSWVKSPTIDVTKVQVVVTNDGTETTTEFGPEVQELVIVVKASTTVQFKVVVTDSEGQVATSSTYTFTLGDLEAPLPATDLKHTILAVRDDMVV